MFIQRLIFALLFIAVITIGCEKNSVTPDCRKLKDGMSSDSSEIVIAVISQLADQLPSKIYTEQNLNELCASIRQQCDFTAEVYCFDCIDTWPPQSEIRISFGLLGDKVEKTIDVTRNPDNTIKILAMHD